MSGIDALLQARALLEGEGVSPDDGAAFLAGLTTALTGADAPKLKVGGDQRQLWARVLVVVAGFLLGPPPPETPPPVEEDEEEEFQLTQSEFEIWQKTQQDAAAAAATAEPTDEPPAPEDSAPPPESESAEEEATEAGEEAPAAPATDDFEDFVIDEIT
jgi:cell division protein FtsN